MKAGIVGLSNIGKSTLFNCLFNAEAQSASFPFCTIEPNLEVVNVPDPHLEKLGAFIRPERVLPVIVEVVDTAGSVRGIGEGGGLGNQFLGNIRKCHTIIHVLRCFDNDNVVHVDDSVDPAYDKETVSIKLRLKDLKTVEKHLEKVTHVAKTNDKRAVKEMELLNRIRKTLWTNLSARSLQVNEEKKELLGNFQSLTVKPVLYVCGVNEKPARNGNAYVEKVKKVVKDENAEVIVLAVATRTDATGLGNYEECQMFLEDIGLEEPGTSKLIRAAYRLLNLRAYFTVGIKEVRAWTVHKGDTAPQAAGVVHTNLGKGFIHAKVIAYDDFITYGSGAKVKEAGKIRVEDKEYTMKDGDIMHFRFNV